MERAHESVLLDEAVGGLNLKPGDTVVDGTLGWGGHARRILEKIGAGGRLIGFDKDAEAIEAAGKELAEFKAQTILIRDDFKNMKQNLEKLGIQRIQAALLDLGVSSPQLDQADRGFGFSKEGPLDMRMDVRQAFSAQDVVNKYSEEKLRDLLWAYGEERFARRIAAAIIQARVKSPFRTTSQLESVIFHAVPGTHKHGRLHPATRTFQAIRIEVNSELESLKFFLAEAETLLDEGARVSIISFHSLEDRIVKTTFREWKGKGLGQILTKKPLTAGDAEAVRNPRARSAKLRIFEKNREAAQ